MIETKRIDKVKNVIRDRYNDADCGLFFTPNLAGDPMSTIWEEDGSDRISNNVISITGVCEIPLSGMYFHICRSFIRRMSSGHHQ